MLHKVQRPNDFVTDSTRLKKGEKKPIGINNKKG